MIEGDEERDRERARRRERERKSVECSIQHPDIAASHRRQLLHASPIIAVTRF